MIEMLKAVLTGKWSGDSEWYIPPRWEWFYRLKAAICVLLNREPDKNTPVWMHIDVTYTAGGSYFSFYDSLTHHWGESIKVGYGIFSDWWCTYYQDED